MSLTLDTLRLFLTQEEKDLCSLPEEIPVTNHSRSINYSMPWL
jgi:hypothetical protein